MPISPDVEAALLTRFVQKKKKDKPAQDPKEARSIPLQLQKLFARLQLSDLRAVKTKDLTKSFGWTDADAFTQHDVQELLRVLFDALERVMKGTAQANLINDLYEGQMKDYVQCQVRVMWTRIQLVAAYHTAGVPSRVVSLGQVPRRATGHPPIWREPHPPQRARGAVKVRADGDP